jgi:hypothetical protein
MKRNVVRHSICSIQKARPSWCVCEQMLDSLAAFPFVLHEQRKELLAEVSLLTLRKIAFTIEP